MDSEIHCICGDSGVRSCFVNWEAMPDPSYRLYLPISWPSARIWPVMALSNVTLDAGVCARQRAGACVRGDIPLTRERLRVFFLS